MLYLRLEPTTDHVARQYLSGKALERCRDVQAYSDPECTQPRARWAWYSSLKPTRRNRRAMVNCASHRCQWVD
jgi:hypothetical protein